MLDCITEITEYTGRMQSLPQWTQQGAIIGLEGGTQDVLNKLESIQQVKRGNISVPISGVWLQDWVCRSSWKYRTIPSKLYIPLLCRLGNTSPTTEID